MDAVGRAKDEILSGMDSGQSTASAIARLSVSFGISESVADDDQWGKSIEALNKKTLVAAAPIFAKARERRVERGSSCAVT